MRPSVAYLTLLEAPNGVYVGQVVDVIKYVREQFEVNVRLIAVLSPRGFITARRKLLSLDSKAVALPAPLGWRAWPLQKLALTQLVRAALPSGCSAVLCRGPVATALGLSLRDADVIMSVGYDGRGAIAAEWIEYGLAPSARWRRTITFLEENAVKRSNVRVSVSQRLVEHWRQRFDYDGNQHIVVPCTLSQHHPRIRPNTKTIEAHRREAGISPDHIVICYSGSAADWQSLHLLDAWLAPIMAQRPNVSLLLMSRADIRSFRIGTAFGARVRQVWVQSHEVAQWMSIADYGFLLRERSLANAVAAPTKFAEYLAAGLKVLISPGVGDYSDLVEKHALGHVIDENRTDLPLAPTSLEERERLICFGHDQFCKRRYRENYCELITGLVSREAP